MKTVYKIVYPKLGIIDVVEVEEEEETEEDTEE